MSVESTTAKLVRNPDLVAADMDGETVMMSIARGEYFGLNTVGSRIWELLAEPATVSDLVTRICAEFNVDRATCSADLAAFTKDLLDNGLVIPA
ncbi:lasso peptide biosynthesis PqqD family chaperone [Massilia solisilvae]|uniref:Lasso peptide biosynthesis PqqD family chaperone n=1 Tax=Massilia solisilvae TaxID=1811225 RepID=A0ABT2BFD9_9BURK|nr:lasso peptide biosynthesis PqqD family chaperone [Massilia solisilvae]MCS0606795.1 lasso peptide biosynthesis PqqD family chaperone [Massilia solisilvae]